MLEGFDWDGAVLRAEWARTEYRPPGSGGKGGGGDTIDSVPAGDAFAHHTAPAWEREKPMAAHYPEQHLHPDSNAQGFRTLHFTNLPAVSETEFEEFLSTTFPEQV